MFQEVLESSRGSQKHFKVSQERSWGSQDILEVSEGVSGVLQEISLVL